MADLVLPRGEIKVLKAEDKDYERGLLVRLLKNGGYDMAYWYNKPDKPYPVEVLVDGKSIKKDAKVVEMKFHPKDYYDKVDEAPRIPRKKGQHRGSKSHSDLYTDENPKGTIKGLKFAQSQMLKLRSVKSEVVVNHMHIRYRLQSLWNRELERWVRHHKLLFIVLTSIR